MFNNFLEEVMNCPFYCANSFMTREALSEEAFYRAPGYRRQARAIIKGGPFAPQIKGFVVFTDVLGGTEVYAEITGLPRFIPAEGNKPQVGPFGFHIHQNGNCTVGDPANPFKDAGAHWNPTKQPHGNHAGDFPVLFSNGGKARMTFFTNKFKVSDIIGKSVMIHESPDDYKTQPAGGSGRRLACGVIIA